MGFSKVRDIPDADDAGRVWVSQFRKLVASAATTTGGWSDYSYFAGSPPANFYASSPLVASWVDESRGIYVPQVGSGMSQHLMNLRFMSAASSATGVTNARQSLLLCDYLLYYPFIDTDAVGEAQDMVNAVTIPRYASGQVIAVAQSAASTTGRFTMTYTNQSGTPGRVSQNTFTIAVSGGGQVVTTGLSANGYHPFVQLQAGDFGVRSIEQVTFTAAGGGLMALVIVKPIFHGVVTQECRRTTTGNLESYGACDEFASLIHQAGAPQIKDGAVLNFFSQGMAGSLASSTLVGTLETCWK